MNELKTFLEYTIRCEWGARAATPESLAPRFLSTIDQLRQIDPGFDGWDWGNEEELIQSEGEHGDTPLPEIRPWMAEAIKENMRREDDTSEPDADLGYRMPAGMYKNSGTQYIHLSISDGDSWSYKTCALNRLELSISDKHISSNPLVTFPIFKAAMLVLAETWEVTWGKAYPNDMIWKIDWDGMNPGWGWMVYVCPHLAKLVTPPAGVIVERRPNGGLFLAATDEVFDADNPRHIAAARLIRDAMRPVTSLEEPFVVPYL